MRASYIERIKALRKLNKGFEAKDGYNLRDVKAGRFPSSRKRKVNRYIKGQAAELAAIVTGRAYKARFFRPDRLEAAIAESQQEDRFKGQKFAVFVTDFPEEYIVKQTRAGRFRTSEFGVSQRRIRFENIAGLPYDWRLKLADDPGMLVEDALKFFGPEFKRFKYMTGKYQSTIMVPRSALAATLATIVFDYVGDEDPEAVADEVSSFITGIVGYT